MRARSVVVIVVAALSVVAGAGLLLERGEPGNEYVSEHPVQVPETVRTVSVSATMPMPSAYAHRLSAKLEAGAMPGHPMMAEVLTDSQCTPDENMVSRCRNEMRLEDGRRIVLRHPHDMRHVSCLAPGERVRLLPV